MPVTPRSPPVERTRQDLTRRSPFTTYLDSLQSSGLHVILDDIRTDVFSFYGKEQGWAVSRDGRWSGGTETRFQGVGDGKYGAFELGASGKEVRIIGRAPSTPGSKASYRIDAGPFVDIDLGSSTPTTSNSNSTEAFPYRQWATIPLPQDSKSHRVFVSELPVGTTVDYAVVAVSDSDLVSKETALLDDADGSLEWKGAWNEVKGEDMSEEIAPYGGGVHESREVGSEVKIQFIGSTISLYSLSPPSILSVSFTMDGGSVQTRTYASPVSSQTADQPIVPNYLLYSAPGLSSSMHTLTVKLTENPSNSSLVLDYVTYTPAFASLAALASSGGDPAKYAPSSSQGQDGSGGKTLSKATLAGTIVGVVVVVIVLLSCFCCRGKRHFARRMWRSWRNDSTKVGKEGSNEKGFHNEKTSADLVRKDSPDWAFTNLKASQYDSRTSLERDLDLDISPRARERRHQDRDRARSRNKHRNTESRGESSRGHGHGESSKSRTRARANSGASGMGRRGDRTGTPPNASRTETVLDIGASTHSEMTLSEVARGKRPAREFANDLVDYEDEAPVSSIPVLTPFITPESTSPLPPPTVSDQTTSRHQEAEATRAAEATAILARMEGGFVAMKKYGRNRHRDRRNMNGVRLMLDAIAAESWLGDRPDLQARVASLKSELKKEELSSTKLCAEHSANRRHRQKRKGATRELREFERRERERSRRDADAHRMVVDPYFVMGDEREVREERGDGVYGKTREGTRVVNSRRVRHPAPKKQTQQTRRWKRADDDDDDVDWVDEDPINEANHITPFPTSTNPVTPFTAMEPSSSASMLKGIGGKDEMANIITPFTATEPSAFVSNDKDVKGGLREGGIRPFMLMHPTPGVLPSKKFQGRSSHPPSSAPSRRKVHRQSLPDKSTSFPNPPASTSIREPALAPSPDILQSQLAALIDEINGQHERGEIPSPERLAEMVRLGRAIEESVEEMERNTGGVALPPPYRALDNEDDQQIQVGIAL